MNYFIKLLFVLLFLQNCKAGIIKERNYFPELQYIDENVDPCNNFYNFACGKFEDFNPKPDKELMWDNFKILQQKVNEITTNILNSSIRSYDSKAVKKAKDMYYACVNPELAAEKSIKPLFDAFKKIGGWPLVNDPPTDDSKFSWDFLGEVTSEFGLPIIFSWTVMPYYDSTAYMIKLDKDPLQLPSNAISDLEDVQNKISVDFKSTISPYKQYLIDVAKKFVRPDHLPIYEEKIEKGIEQVYEILLEINKLIDEDMDEDEYGDIDNIEELQEWTDTFQTNFTKKINWLSFFSKAFSKSDVKITKETKINASYQYILKYLLTLVENTPDDVILNFIFTRLVSFTAQDTDTKMWNMFNELYKKLGYTVYSREEYCMRKVTSYPGIGLSLAVAHEFQNYHFDLRKISKPEEIIEDMLESFFELLEEKDWVDDHAKEWIKNKTEDMLRLVAFPDNVYDTQKLDEYYKDLEVCNHDHFGNSQRIRAFNFAKSIEVLDKPRTRDNWSQSPLIVNAFYNPASNRITFPAGIMDLPFFSGTSKLIDYSRIGALIGHEITHAFDSNGRLYDGNGSYIGNVWHANVTKAYDERKDCFIKQYNKYIIEEINQNVNGGTTIAENIADNGGIREAFRAFQKLNDYSNYPREQLTGQYTSEQLFFISYASMWCKVDTNESLEIMNEKDEHAPNRFRVIGTLSNMKEFSEAFNCKIGSNMNPENKCILW